jgi:hypothetical protein
LNQNNADSGIPNRFKLGTACSSARLFVMSSKFHEPMQGRTDPI